MEENRGMTAGREDGGYNAPLSSIEPERTHTADVVIDEKTEPSDATENAVTDVNNNVRRDEDNGSGQSYQVQTAADGGENNAVSGTESSESNSVASMLPLILSALGGGSHELKQSGKEKMNLLMAVKPFVHEPHRHSIDRAVSLVKIAQAAQGALDGLGGLGESLFK